MTVGDKRRMFCNSCRERTWHDVRAEHRTEFTPEKYEEMTVDYAGTVASILQCAGCDDVLFIEMMYNSEDEEPFERVWPEPSTKREIAPKDYMQLPMFLEYIYQEVIRAANANCPTLCAGGIRTLLEGICDDRNVTRRGKLQQKIEGLKGLVAPSIVDNLHSIRFLGNDALHKQAVPDAKDLALAIEVVEDVMNAIYELDYKSGRLYQRVKKGRTPVEVAEGETLE